ncbi:coenzyme F420-reducing hydrogenase beta subunit [Paraburkholderia sp. GAS448]|uniref:hypothetical protein n=1 Tax=Paraburkholderia sp. GAS448 TaxID=3035136 RepID=UPI003D1B0185
MNQKTNEAGKLADVTDADMADAKAAGFVVELGAADCPEENLRGRWWWTLTQPRWSGIEASEGDFDTEAAAWADAIRLLRSDPSLTGELQNGAIVTVQRTYALIADKGDLGVVVDGPEAMRGYAGSPVLVTARG